ncbi:MAG: UxaA family hydrolase [Anaerolineae bacterium]|nr:UxaA family hydrolase [Anaerolineae bacterium]
MVNVLRIHPADSVVMAMTDLPAGSPLDLGDGQIELAIETGEPIPFGHKIAIVPLERGQHVIKYGASIGVATRDIAPGQHVHSHNLATVRGAARP